MKKLGYIALLCALLIGCAEKNAIEPTPLEPISAEFAVQQVWSNRYAHSTEAISKKRSLSVGTWLLTVSDVRGNLALYNRLAGDRLWKIQYPDAFGTQGLIVEEIFYGSNLKGQALGLDLAQGTLLWEQALLSGIESAPAYAPGFLVYHLHDGRLVALNPDNGELLWLVRTQVPSVSLLNDATPLIDGGRIYTGFANGHVMAFDLKTGATLWDKPVVLSSDLSAGTNILNILGPLNLSQGVIYTSSFHDRVVALQEEDGKVLWDRSIPTSEHVLLAGDTLVVVDQDDQVHGLNAQTGETLWVQKALRGRQVTAAVALEYGVMIADSFGYLHGLSLTDGHLISRYSLPGGSLRQEPIVFDGVLYLLSEDGKMQALTMRPL